MDGMPRAALSAAASERLLLVERLLVLTPRSRGFRVDADGTINIYAGTPTRAARHKRLPCRLVDPFKANAAEV